MGYGYHPRCKSAEVLIVGSIKTASMFYHEKEKRKKEKGKRIKKKTLIICVVKLTIASFSHLERQRPKIG